MAGVAGLEPTLTESKSVELTNYSIPQYKKLKNLGVFSEELEKIALFRGNRTK